MNNQTGRDSMLDVLWVDHLVDDSIAKLHKDGFFIVTKEALEETLDALWVYSGEPRYYEKILGITLEELQSESASAVPPDDTSP
jgi:hypothetical protein